MSPTQAIRLYKFPYSERPNFQKFPKPIYKQISRIGKYVQEDGVIIAISKSLKSPFGIFPTFSLISHPKIPTAAA